MRVERVVPGRRAPGRLEGAVLTRDLTLGGKRWSKGRRLTADDLAALAAADPGPPVSVIVIEPGDDADLTGILDTADVAAGSIDWP